MIVHIYLTADTTNSEILGEGNRNVTMSSIYEQDIYSNINCSDIFLWHTVCHAAQNMKLQSVADR